MAMELVYTSAARGLRPGSSGFCTVAMTAAMPAPLVPRLEALGGYRPGPSGNGPVAFCHWRVETASGEVHVLSRVGPAPADHTGRSNKIATYLVLGKGELPDAGPAWLLAHPGLLRDSWAGEPRVVAEPVSVPRGEPAPLRASAAWQRACGDAGWAGVVASSFLRERQRPIHVVIHEGTDALALADDVIRLLPGWARWSLTFSTYFLQAVAGTPCALRFCVEGTPAAEAARNSKSPLVDLTRPVGLAPDSRYVRMARSGVFEPEPSAQHAPAALPAEAGGAPAASPSAAPDRPAREAAPSLPEDEPAEEPEASSRPLVIAVVAGVVTLVLLGALVTISTSGTQPVPTGAEQPAPQAEPAPAAERTQSEEPARHEATGGDAPRAPSTRTAPARPGAGGTVHSPFGAPPTSPAAPPSAKPAPAPSPPPAPAAPAAPVVPAAPAAPAVAPPASAPDAPAAAPSVPPAAAAPREPVSGTLVVGRPERINRLAGSLVVRAVAPDGARSEAVQAVAPGQTSEIVVGPFLAVEVRHDRDGSAKLKAAVVDAAALAQVKAKLSQRITELRDELGRGVDGPASARIKAELAERERDHADAISAEKGLDAPRQWSILLLSEQGQPLDQFAIRVRRAPR